LEDLYGKFTLKEIFFHISQLFLDVSLKYSFTFNDAFSPNSYAHLATLPGMSLTSSCT